MDTRSPSLSICVIVKKLLKRYFCILDSWLNETYEAVKSIDYAPTAISLNIIDFWENGWLRETGSDSNYFKDVVPDLLTKRI